ncbi:OmpH family outer membrane protein [Flammeovirgaceae bacterium SG7u.111]|nr:OmpH family outer membrane protein [Flammeovirgaceae bacterium SG7u.132]WPO38696.1 OmpH family outer membrane protein [Flammeovirgaceae bacterium SG7u.111]
MKNLPIILSAIVLLAIIPLYVTVFGGKSEGEAASAGSVDTPAGSVKIAYINNDSLVTYYKFYEDASEKLNVNRDKIRKQLETRGTKLQYEVRNVEQRAQAGLMSRNDIAAAEQDLMKKQQDLQQYQQTVSAGLMAEEQKLNEEIFENINSYLDSMNMDSKYDLIINYVPGTVFWRAENNVIDITQQVIDGLNAKYEAEKAAEPAE